MNNRLVTSLFLSKLDAEEIYSSVQNIEYVEEKEARALARANRGYNNNNYDDEDDYSYNETENGFGDEDDNNAKPGRKYKKLHGNLDFKLNPSLREHRKVILDNTDIDNYTRHCTER